MQAGSECSEGLGRLRRGLGMTYFTSSLGWLSKPLVEWRAGCRRPYGRTRTKKCHLDWWTCSQRRTCQWRWLLPGNLSWWPHPWISWMLSHWSRSYRNLERSGAVYGFPHRFARSNRLFESQSCHRFLARYMWASFRMTRLREWSPRNRGWRCQWFLWVCDRKALDLEPTRRTLLQQPIQRDMASHGKQSMRLPREPRSAFSSKPLKAA